MAPRAASPAARSATTSAWSPPKRAWKPSPTTWPSRTTTAPTSGLGATWPHPRRARAMARRMNARSALRRVDLGRSGRRSRPPSGVAGRERVVALLVMGSEADAQADRAVHPGRAGRPWKSLKVLTVRPTRARLSGQPERSGIERDVREDVGPGEPLLQPGRDGWSGCGARRRPTVRLTATVALERSAVLAHPGGEGRRGSTTLPGHQPPGIVAQAGIEHGERVAAVGERPSSTLEGCCARRSPIDSRYEDRLLDEAEPRTVAELELAGTASLHPVGWSDGSQVPVARSRSRPPTMLMPTGNPRKSPTSTSRTGSAAHLVAVGIVLRAAAPGCTTSWHVSGRSARTPLSAEAEAEVSQPADRPPGRAWRCRRPPAPPTAGRRGRTCRRPSGRRPGRPGRRRRARRPAPGGEPGGGPAARPGRRRRRFYVAITSDTPPASRLTEKERAGAVARPALRARPVVSPAAPDRIRPPPRPAATPGPGRPSPPRPPKGRRPGRTRPPFRRPC